MTAENVIPTTDSHGMGKTSDGIAATDWDRVHELALAVVNADDSLDEESHRRELLKYLDELTSKYGELPSLLATCADYIDDRVEAERLLLRAFEVAKSIDDTRNLCEISLSLADLYTSDRRRRVAARVWLDRARAHMSADDDVGWRESCRIEKRLDESAIDE
jgi:hypothetical protein